MKSKIINIFWGITLIVVSALLLAEALGFVSFGSITYRKWAVVYGVASAAFLLTYFMNGVRQWVWLFPAMICAALSWSSIRTGRAVDFINLDWPMLAGLAIPFYVGFALERKRWGLLIPAYTLTVPALIGFSNEVAMDLFRSAGSYSRIRLLIASGAGQMFLFALPFFVAYFWSKKNWWALIPAGGLTSIGLINVLMVLIPHEQNTLTGLFNATLFVGFAATMGVLWLRGDVQSTGWARYPALGFLALAILAFILGNRWTELSEGYRAIVFAAGSSVFFLAYFLHGVRKWGWLFPALACTAISLMIWMENSNIEGSITAVPLFASVALPFYVGFAVQRTRRGLLIPAALLTFVTVFFLVTDLLEGEWAGVLFFFLMALPFFVIYFLSKKNWWALIPGGGFASFGLTLLVDILIPHQEYPSLPNTLSFDVFIWILFLGLAATFGAVWLRHESEPTEWAKYPAAGLLAIAVLALLLGEHFQEVWLATVVAVIGVMLLLAALMRRQPVAGQQPQ